MAHSYELHFNIPLDRKDLNGAHMYDTDYSCVRHDSIKSVTWRIHMSLLLNIPLDMKTLNGAHVCDTTSSYVTRLHHMCDLTQSHVHSYPLVIETSHTI